MESKVFQMIAAEQKRQDENIELIASENFVSENVMKALGSCLTNKYAEGYPAVRDTGNKGRYYGGCAYVDAIETYCCQKWQEVFQTNYHVNVQPHSGSNANLAAYMSVLKPGDTILAMSLNNGGHLTHGSPVNFSGKLFHVVFYDVGMDGLIDYNDLEAKLISERPHLVLAGASAYSRVIDFARIRKAIDRNSDANYRPYFMVDMAHIAGLVAAGDHPTPFGLADIITTTTHKTLRGPRGGMIFCCPELARKVDSAVFPCTQGGPLEHVIAGKAVCAEETLTEKYHDYIHQVVRNCKAMANEFMKLGFKVVSGGTDNHLFLLDLTDTGLSGKQVQDELDKHHITLNKNMIPGDTRSPVQTSGVRIGTAAMTTKGYREADFIHVADRIAGIIQEMQVKVQTT